MATRTPAKPRKREAQVEGSLVRYAAKKGVLTFKFSSPSHRGVPDRIFMCNGNVLFLEIKRPGERPTKLQEHTMRAIKNCGVAVDWVDNEDDGKAFIDSLLEAKNCGCIPAVLREARGEHVPLSPTGAGLDIAAPELAEDHDDLVDEREDDQENPML